MSPVPSEVRDGSWYATIGSAETATFHDQYHGFPGRLSLGDNTVTVPLHAESNDGGTGLDELPLQPVVR